MPTTSGDRQNVIKSFLVELGWRVDSTGEATFRSSLKEAQSMALKLSATLAGVGAAVLTVVERYTRLRYEAWGLGGSVSGIQSLEYAMRQVGGSAQGVHNALQNIANFIQFGGSGAETFFQNLGVRTRDAKGNLRDVSDLFVDFGKAIGNMPGYRQEAYANVLGIDANTLRALRANPDAIHQRRDEYNDVYKRLGLNPDEAAEQAKQLTQQINRLMLAIGAMTNKIAISLVHAFGGKTLDDFTNKLLSHSDEIAQAIKEIADFTLVATRAAVRVASAIDAVITKTVGWKNAIVGVFAVFTGAKIIGVLQLIAKMSSSLVKATRVVGAVVAGAAAPEIGGAVVAGAAVAGAGYAGYKILSQHTADEGHVSTHMATTKKLQTAQQKAMAYFQSMGLSQAQAAGIVGNLTQESGLDPTRQGDGGRAFGLGQLHEDRAADVLKRFGIDVHKAGFDDQLRAIYLEATRGKDALARKSWKELQKAKTPEEAASIFRRLYERPQDKYHNEDAIRGQIARGLMTGQNTNNTQNNTININAHGATATPEHIAGAVDSKTRQGWQGMVGNTTPRRHGLLGAS